MAGLDRQRTIVLGALFVALFFIVAGTHNTIPIFITPFIRLYGWPHSRAVIIPTIFTLVWGLSSPVASTIPLTVIAARWFGERRGFAMGVAVAGMSFGGVILPPITDYIIRTMSIGAAYVVLGIPIGLVALPLVAFVIRKPSDVKVSHTPAAPAPDLPGLDTYEAMRSASFWILIGAIYLGSISLATLFYFITPSLIHAGFSSRNATLVQSGQNLIAVPGLIAAGVLADRFTGRKVAAVMLAGLGLASMLLMEAGSGSPAWPLYVAAFMLVFGSTAGVTAAVFPIALAELVGLKRYGTLAGIMALASTFGMATGPLLVGRFFQSSGNYALGFEVGASLCLASAGMMLILVMGSGLAEVTPSQIRAAARH